MRGAGVRVFIVGAGVAGLAAARPLRGWGAEVAVVERMSAATCEGTGIYLPGNAVRALHDLGLADAVAGHGVRIGRQVFADHRGRVLVDVDTAGVWNALGDCLAVHRDAQKPASSSGSWQSMTMRQLGSSWDGSRSGGLALASPRLAAHICRWSRG